MWCLIACMFNPGDAFKSNAILFSVRSNASDQNCWTQPADQTNACYFVSRFLSDSQLNTQNQKEKAIATVFASTFEQFYKLFHKLRQKNEKIYFNSFSFFGCLHSDFGLKNHFDFSSSLIRGQPTIFSGMQYFSSACCVFRRCEREAWREKQQNDDDDDNNTKKIK